MYKENLELFNSVKFMKLRYYIFWLIVTIKAFYICNLFYMCGYLKLYAKATNKKA